MAERPALYVHVGVTRRLLALPGLPWEVGGWLLGYWSADERSVVISHATPPGPRGTPFGVRIGAEGHRDRFDQAWTASDGHVTFLGDWHTHPGGPVAPSEKDREALRKLATQPDYDTPQPLAIIVQAPRWPWQAARRALGCFMRDSKGAVEPLAMTVTDELAGPAASVPPWRWPARRWPG
ncbi:MAG: Mov34/MPN/PAD-1 family protein [Chloroflexi bacterium]|nr:Mov34/MPN/PAD-1 family protein [Chloroflexota bacterium]